MDNWNHYYQGTNKLLKYPDENLIRILEKNMNPLWKTALDYGCGQGRHIKLLKEMGFGEIYGIDSSKHIVEKNKILFPYATFIHFNSEHSLPFENSYFDAIIVWGVLHYNSIEKRTFLLKEFNRTLKNHGCIIGTYRAKNDTHFFQSEVKESEIYFFDSESIMKELKLYFQNIQLGYTERTPLGNLSQKIAHYFFLAYKK